MEHPLTSDQQTVFDIIENSSENIIVHGKPGVGKTVLIQALKEYGQKHYTIGAPTGLAAQLGGGKTLHSLFGIPVSKGIFTRDFNKFTNNPNVRNNILHTIKYLIIDEISMVRCDLLDYVNRLLQDVKQNAMPFGGVQVIAFGDFFQLPPVVNSEDRKQLKEAGYKSEFAFDAACFESFRPLILDKVLRQKDLEFLKILHSARTGKINLTQLRNLNKRVEACTDIRVRLTAKNDQADTINLHHLRQINEPLREYHANSFGAWDKFPHDTVLTLKVGAQVLIKKNAADRLPNAKGGFSSEVVNGSLGIITELCEKTDDAPQRVMVKLRNDKVVPIYTNRWEQKVKEKIGDQWTERVIASFEQIPLQLAWAISMHKSQGQSFEFVHVDPVSIFTAGQIYVALSRARSLDGLSLERPVRERDFMTNEKVLRYVQQIEQQAKEYGQQREKPIIA